MKAVATRPEDRYPTPRALADDLERWMADEPVTAWREPFSHRVRRWARRNRTVVTALAAAVLVALAGTAAVLAVQTRASSRLRQANSALEVANVRVMEANAELKSANEREKERFNLAMDAIELFHGEVSEDLLMKEKQFDGLRTKLLKGAADFYGRLEVLLKGQTDRASRAALGKAYVDLAELTGKIGDQTAALAVHRKALAVHRALAAEPGADIGSKLEVARGLTAAGWLQRSIGDMAGALASFEQARGVAEEVETEGGAAEQARGVLGTAYSLTGNVLADTGDPAGRGPPTTRRWPSGESWPTPTPATGSSGETWRRPTTASASCNPGRAIRPGHSWPTARRWPSSKNWPTPTPMSRNSSKTYRGVT